MSDDPHSSDEVDDRVRIPWEVPEVVATALLLAVTLLIAGGLATGIASEVAASALRGSPAAESVGLVIQEGASWASPPLAAVLLGVIGLCWWQYQGRLSEAAGVSVDDEDTNEAASHIHRAYQIARWTRGALGMIVAGSMAMAVGGGLISSGGNTAANSENWAREASVGAALLAVMVIAGAGIWVGRQLTDAPTSAGWGLAAGGIRALRLARNGAVVKLSPSQWRTSG